jgi:hypothetical protein
LTLFFTLCTYHGSEEQQCFFYDGKLKFEKGGMNQADREFNDSLRGQTHKSPWGERYPMDEQNAVLSL